MDSSISPKDKIWFLRVCHHISNAVYHCCAVSWCHIHWHTTLWYVTSCQLAAIKFWGNVPPLSPRYIYCCTLKVEAVGPGVSQSGTYFCVRIQQLRSFISTVFNGETTIRAISLDVACEWRGSRQIQIMTETEDNIKMDHSEIGYDVNWNWLTKRPNGQLLWKLPRRFISV